MSVKSCALLLLVSAQVLSGVVAQTQQHSETESKSSAPEKLQSDRISATALKSKGQFPSYYLHILKNKGDLPGWANYACFDPDPHLESSYFLLVAYSPKPIQTDATKRGLVKGVTFQAYIGDMPINRPPTMEEFSQAMNNVTTDNPDVPVRVYEMLNAWRQARQNVELVIGLNKEKDGWKHFVWIAQKYMNGVQPSDSAALLAAKMTVDDLGMILYESAPGTNVFRTKSDSDKELLVANDLVMQPTNEGLFFSLVSHVNGLRTLPQHGRCELIPK